MTTVAKICNDILVKMKYKTSSNWEILGTKITEDHVSVSYHPKEGFYGWVFHKGQGSVPHLALTSRSYIKQKDGWFGAGAISAPWQAEGFPDIPKDAFFEVVYPFFMTLKQFRAWLNARINDGEITTIEADKEEVVEAPVQTTPTIETVYRLDGQIFTTLDEAQEHLLRIKLFNIFNTGGDVNYSALHGTINTIIKEKEAFKVALQ